MFPTSSNKSPKGLLLLLSFILSMINGINAQQGSPFPFGPFFCNEIECSNCNTFQCGGSNNPPQCGTPDCKQECPGCLHHDCNTIHDCTKSNCLTSPVCANACQNACVTVTSCQQNQACSNCDTCKNLLQNLQASSQGSACLACAEATCNNPECAYCNICLKPCTPDGPCSGCKKCKQNPFDPNAANCGTTTCENSCGACSIHLSPTPAYCTNIKCIDDPCANECAGCTRTCPLGRLSTSTTPVLQSGNGFRGIVRPAAFKNFIALASNSLEGDRLEFIINSDAMNLMFKGFPNPPPPSFASNVFKFIYPNESVLENSPIPLKFNKPAITFANDGNFMVLFVSVFPYIHFFRVTEVGTFGFNLRLVNSISEKLGQGPVLDLSILGNSMFAPSNFVDFDGDGFEDDIIIGGETGKLLGMKMRFGESNTSTILPQFQTFLVPNWTNAYNQMDNRVFGKQSSPAIQRPIATESFMIVVVGYSTGNVMVFNVSKSTFTWNPLFPVDSTIGVRFGNTGVYPLFRFLDADAREDGLVFGEDTGTLRFALIKYTGNQTQSSGCVDLKCGLGNGVRSCSCQLCPPGTYNNQTQSSNCQVCGDANSFCPQGSVFPQFRSGPEYCTMNTMARFNSQQLKQISLDGVLVLLGGGNPVPYIPNVASFDQFDRFGGLVQLRDAQYLCGTLNIPVKEVNITGTAPNILFGNLFVENFNSVEFMNVTFSSSFFGGLIIASSIDPTRNLIGKSDAIPSGSTRQYVFQVDSSSFNSAQSFHEFNVTLEEDQYWSQGFQSKVFHTITVKVTLVEATIIVLPSEITGTVKQGISQFKSLTVYNLKPGPQQLRIEVALSGTNPFSENSGNLLRISDGSFTSNVTIANIGDGCTCQPASGNSSVCEAEERGIAEYSKNVNFELNSLGLVAGRYTGFVKFITLANSATLDIPIDLQITGGVVDWSKTAIFINRPQFTVELGLEYKFEPRDVAFNPTLDIGVYDAQNNPSFFEITFEMEYSIGEAFCPPELEFPPFKLCNNTAVITYNQNTQSWIGGFFPLVSGDYTIKFKNPLHFSVPIEQRIIQTQIVTVHRINCPATDNSEINQFGSKCVCSAGYGRIGGNSFYEQCEECPPGTFANDTCKPCPAGLMSVNARSITCTSCSLPFTEPNADQTDCVLCGPSQFVNATTGGCENCPIGMVPFPNNTCQFCENRNLEQPNDDGSACEPCEDEMYVPDGSTTHRCERCSNNKIPVLRNGKFVCECRSGFFEAPDGTCGICPEGCCCNGRNYLNILPLQGRFKILEGNVTTCSPCREITEAGKQNCKGVKTCSVDDAETAASIQEFLSEQASNQNGCTKCGEGFTGVLCFKCDVSYHRTGVNDCTKCLDRQIVIFSMVIGALVAVLLVVYFIRRTINKGSEDSAEIIILRTATSSMQMISMQNNLGIVWPIFLTQFFTILDYLSSAGQSVFSLDCLLNIEEVESNESDSCTIEIEEQKQISTFFLTAIFIACLPILSILLSGVFWSGRFLYSGRSHGRTYFNFFLVSNILIFFLIHPTLSRYALRFFTCSKESFQTGTNETVNFLEADFNVVCWSQEHKAWAFTLGLYMLFGYAIGIPLCFFLILYRFQNHPKAKYREVFNFVYQGLHSKFFFWAILNMLRNLAFAFIAVVLKPIGTDVQAYSALIVITLAIVSVMHFMPYNRWIYNFAEFFGLIVPFLTIFMGLFMESPNITSLNVDVGLSIVILVLTCSYLLFISYFIFFAGGKVFISRVKRLYSKEQVSVSDDRAGSKAITTTKGSVGAGASPDSKQIHKVREESDIMEYEMNEIQNKRIVPATSSS